jgi:hypothetical protein
MLKGHMSLLYVGCRKVLTNRFVGNFYPSRINNTSENANYGFSPIKDPQ